MGNMGVAWGRRGHGKSVGDALGAAKGQREGFVEALLASGARGFDPDRGSVSLAFPGGFGARDARTVPATHATELVLQRPGFSETFDLLHST